MSSNIVMIVFKTTGYTEVEATTFIQSLLEVSGVKISIRPAQVASGTYVVIVQKSEELDDFLECNSQPVTGAGGKSYHCYEAGKGDPQPAPREQPAHTTPSPVPNMAHAPAADCDCNYATSNRTGYTNEAVYMPGPHIHITGIKPVIDGIIADAMRSVVDRPLRAVRGISQKGAAYANIIFDEEVTYEEVAYIAQQLRRADAAVYANIVEDGKVCPTFTLYMRKRVPQNNFHVTKISAEKPTEAELYEAFGKYGVVVSVHIPLARHTAYVQFKDEPTLNIEELRETLASPELHVAQYATAKDRASRTLFLTFPIEFTEDEIREIIAKHTTAVPKIMPKREGFEVRAATITLATAEAMTTLLDQIKSDSLVVEALTYCPRAQRQAEIAKMYEDRRAELKVNYRDCIVYVSSISTAGVDMAALREKFAQFIGDREIIRQAVFNPKEGAETTVGFVQFATPATAAEFVAAINGKTNAEVFEGLFVEEITEGKKKVEKVTEQGKRVLKAAIVRPKEEHVSAKAAAAPEATINDEERTRRGNFAYPLINTFVYEHPEAVALVDAIVVKHQTADINEDECVTNIEDAVSLCTGLIIDKQFGNFDQEFTENIRYYVMNVLNEIKDE